MPAPADGTLAVTACPIRHRVGTLQLGILALWMLPLSAATGQDMGKAPKVASHCTLEAYLLRSPTAARYKAIALADSLDEPLFRISTSPPLYPPPLLKAGVEGWVIVAFIVDTDGHPAFPSAPAFSDSAFITAAVTAIERSTFAVPGTAVSP